MATSKTTLSRPAYYQGMLDSLANQANNIGSTQYFDRVYSGLNNNQTQALQNLIDSSALNNYANSYIASGNEGLNNLDSVYNQLNNFSGYTTNDVDALANQFYDEGAVQDVINANNEYLQQNLARNTLPTVSEAYGGQQGSGQRMAKSFAKSDVATQGMEDANTITNNAYNTAQQQADALLSNNQSEKINALSGLYSIGSNQANNLYAGANYSNQANQNALYAGNVYQQNQQNINDNNYNNRINAQNLGWSDIQNMINASSVLNSGYGMTTTQKTSGGGSGFLGGALSGAAAGSSFGPYGALAGAALGGLSTM